MKLGLGLGLCRNSQADYGPQVLARLAGTTGFARDPIAANLFQDTAAATPVTTAGQSIGRANMQWGTAAPNWQQATGADQPTWDGTGIAYSGAQFLAPFSALGLLNNAPGFFACERVQVSSLATQRNLTAFATNSAVVGRAVTVINTNGSIDLFSRRLDADPASAVTISSAAGVVTAGVPYVITAELDWGNATGQLGRIWVNGALVASASLPGAAGNTSATDSARVRDGASLGGTAPPSFFYAGWKRRGVFAPYVLNAADRALMEAWVGAK